MYSCESDIVIFERRVTWNYAYSPFKPSLPGSNQPLVKSISSLIYLINLVVRCRNTLEDVFTGRDHQSGESEGTSRDGNSYNFGTFSQKQCLMTFKTLHKNLRCLNMLYKLFFLQLMQKILFDIKLVSFFRIKLFALFII